MINFLFNDDINFRNTHFVIANNKQVLSFKFYFVSFIFIRPHRSTTYTQMRPIVTDGVAWCLSVGLSRSWVLPKRLNRSRCRSWTRVGPRKHVDIVHIGATRQIGLNRPCTAAMRSYVKLLLPTVFISWILFRLYICRFFRTAKATTQVRGVSYQARLDFVD